MIRSPRKFRAFSDLEMLERRDVPSVYRTIDGGGNNLGHPDWGRAGASFLRLAPSDYADGVGSPAGANRPSARAISNMVSDHPAEEIKNNRDMSNFVYAWGQFIDHDLDLTNSSSSAGSMPIPVPAGDPYFDPNNTGTQVIPLTRSSYVQGVTSPRQQVNSITAFLDGSMIYGSDAATAASLRTMVNGKLRTGANNLLPDDPNIPGFFLAGDIRASENPQLIALQTLFVREHNRIAMQLKAINPSWSDEKLYQEARRRVIAQVQAITYNEFLPALLGPNAMLQYQGYNPNINAGISNEFATAAYRFGHSMVGDDVEFLDNNGQEVAPPLTLAQAFFNTSVIRNLNIDPVLKYLASDQAEEIDTKIVDGLRNFLFGPPGQGGLDLASLNIQRGRDHGLNDYNDVRAAYGLPRVQSFYQITSDVALRKYLQVLYGNVNNIDLWVGGLAEDHVPGGSLGPTFTRIIANQFDRTRAGDRFWYERDFAGSPELPALRNTKLSDVIRRNTQLTNLQSNVFFFRTAIGGTVFFDGNRNGHRDGPETGLGGIRVELHNLAGQIVASTVTAANGSYLFTDVGLGRFTVRVVPPSNLVPTTPLPPPVNITRGMDVTVNFGLAPRIMPPAPPPPPPRPMPFDEGESLGLRI